MAIIIDSQMPSNVGQASSAGVNSFSYSFTNTSGTLLVVGIVFGGGGSAAISSVTYASATMTFINNTRPNGTTGLVAMYYLLNPATGSNTVSITGSGNDPVGRIISGALSLTGHDPVNPIAQSTTANSGIPRNTVSLTNTATSSLIVDCQGNGNTMGATSSKSLSWLLNVNTSAAANNAASSTANGGGGVNINYPGAGADFWAAVAAEIIVPTDIQMFDQTPGTCISLRKF